MNATPESLVEYLKEFGIEATLEHPGYVNVRLSDQFSLNVGTANACWDADVVNANGEVLESRWLATLDTPVTTITATLLRVVIHLFEQVHVTG